MTARLAAFENTVAQVQQAPGTDAALRGEVQQLEKRLTARLAAFENTVAQVQQAPGTDAALRGEVQQLEKRLTARLAAHEQATGEAVKTLREQLAGVSTEVTAAGEETGQGTLRSDAVNRQMAALTERMTAVEQNAEEVSKQFATLQENMAADLHDFEQTLKQQTISIDSARTAMAQTDDLVERVVEALELLQTSMIDQHETAGVN